MITLALALCLTCRRCPLSQETTAAKAHRTVFSNNVDGDEQPAKVVYEINP